MLSKATTNRAPVLPRSQDSTGPGEGNSSSIKCSSKRYGSQVKLASVITGSTRVWVRERAAEKFSGIFHDPALGKSCLFEEARRIKGKNDLPKRVKKMFNIEN